MRATVVLPPAPAYVSSVARQRRRDGCPPVSGQPLRRHRWCLHQRHNVGATTCAPPSFCRLSPADVSSVAHQRMRDGCPPASGQPLCCHRWWLRQRHNVGATTYVPPVGCHQPATAVSTVASPPSVPPPSRHRRITVGLPLPPLPCHRLPPSRHHCLVNWGITQHPVNMVDKAATSIHRPNVVLPALSHPMASTP